MKWVNIKKHYAKFGETDWTMTRNKIDAQGTEKFQLFQDGKLKGTDSNPRVIMDLHKELTK